MTRSEFLREISCFSELREFCEEEGLSDCDDYVDGDCLDEAIDEDIRYCDMNWRDVRDYLNDIITGEDFYRKDGCLDYVPMDSEDFESLKQDVLSYMDNYGEWGLEDDDEEDETDEVDEESVDDEYVYTDPVIEDPNSKISIDDFFFASA